MVIVEEAGSLVFGLFDADFNNNKFIQMAAFKNSRYNEDSKY